MLAAVGRPELADDPRFAQRDGRVAHADELHAMIGAWAGDRTLVEALGVLEDHGVAVAPVREPAEAVRDPRVRQRREVVPLRLPDGAPGREVFGPGMPFVMSGSDVSLDRPAPRLGEHTASVLADLLGLSADDVRRLADDGVV